MPDNSNTSSVSKAWKDRQSRGMKTILKKADEQEEQSTVARLRDEYVVKPVEKAVTAVADTMMNKERSPEEEAERQRKRAWNKEQDADHAAAYEALRNYDSERKWKASRGKK